MIEVITDWMEHSGGTKFYQVFEFRPKDGGTPITLIHYGARKESTSVFSRPVLGGRTQVKRGPLRRTQLRLKEKGGYQIASTRSLKAEKDDPYWVHNFGATLAHCLMTEMYPHGNVETDEPCPSDEVDNSVMGKAVVAPDVRPAGWGSW